MSAWKELKNGCESAKESYQEAAGLMAGDNSYNATLDEINQVAGEAAALVAEIMVHTVDISDELDTQKEALAEMRAAHEAAQAQIGNIAEIHSHPKFVDAKQGTRRLGRQIDSMQQSSDQSRGNYDLNQLGEFQLSGLELDQKRSEVSRAGELAVKTAESLNEAVSKVNEYESRI